MIMECDKEKISIHQNLDVQKEGFQIENDIIVNDVKPDVLNIIDTNGILCVNKKEITDGKVKIEGEINTYIMYLADDENGSTRCLSACLDFSQVIPIKNYNENINLNIKCKLKNIESKIINGRKINVKANIEVYIKPYMDSNIEIVNNIENIDNIKVLKTNKQILSCIGSGFTKVSAKDTISLNDESEMAEIINVNFKVVDKEIKTSYNKILIKANADIMVLYMTEEGRIKSVNSKIPIMGFIDMPDVKDNCIYNISEQLMNIIIRSNNGKEESLYIEAELEIQVELYDIKQVDIVEDLYSTVVEAMPNKRTLNAMVERDTIIEEYKIKETVEKKELENSTIFLDDVSVNILKEDIRNGKIIYEGEAQVKILYIKEDKSDVINVQIPFNFEVISDKINTNSILNTEIVVKNENLILQGDKIDINMILEFNIEVEKNDSLDLIENIEIEEIAEKNPYSMVIYFVKPGDTLWKIAKKFKSTVENIVRVNDIENPDKIYQGEQLYIPKCVKCNEI